MISLIACCSSAGSARKAFCACTPAAEVSPAATAWEVRERRMLCRRRKVWGWAIEMQSSGLSLNSRWGNSSSLRATLLGLLSRDASLDDSTEEEEEF